MAGEWRTFPPGASGAVEIPVYEDYKLPEAPQGTSDDTGSLDTSTITQHQLSTSLLILPFPPSPPATERTYLAYGNPIKETLKRLKNLKNSPGPKRLIIMVPNPILCRTAYPWPSKAFSWSQVHKLLADIYSLVATFCSELDIDTELRSGTNGVDVRIVLVHHDRNDKIDPESTPEVELNSTLILDLPSFAAAYHPWDRIFHVASEEGALVFRRWRSLAQWKSKLRHEQFIEVLGGSVIMEPSQQAVLDLDYPQQCVCLGGTFDYLHIGHKLLLTAALLCLYVGPGGKPCRFVVGITGDELLKNKKHAEFILPWHSRAADVLLFLASLLQSSSNGFTETFAPTSGKAGSDSMYVGTEKAWGLFRSGSVLVECVQIHDIYGPTVTDPLIKTLVVSGETRSGAGQVQAERVKAGLNPLQIREVDVLGNKAPLQQTEGYQDKISSSAIRERRAEAARTAKI